MTFKTGCCTWAVLLSLCHLCLGFNNTMEVGTNTSLSARVMRQSPPLSEKELLRLHPCTTKFPCLNMGDCIPIKSKEGRLTSDYKCNCFYTFYDDRMGVDDHYCYEMRKTCNYRSENIYCYGFTSYCNNNWGSYFCHCRDLNKQIGNYCDDEGYGDSAHERLSSFYNVLDPEAITAHPYFILFFQAPDSHLGHKFDLRLDTGEGLYLFDDRPWGQGEMGTFMRYFSTPTLRKWLHDLHLNKSNRRSFKLVQHAYHGKNREVRLNLTIRNKEKNRYKNSTVVRIKKDPDECVPTLEIIGCSPQAAGFKLKETIKDLHSVEQFYLNTREPLVFRPYILQDCAEYESFIRVVWLTHHPPYGKDGVHQDFPNRSQPGRTVIGPRQYTADYVKARSDRIRAVELVAYELIDENIYKHRISYLNSVKCQISDLSDELNIVVVGGPSRSAGAFTPLIMDATFTHHGGHLMPYYLHSSFTPKFNYSWKCSSTSAVTNKYCQQTTMDRAQIYVPKGSLEGNTDITFTLNITTIANSLKIINIKMRNGTLPYLDIRCLRNCGSGSADGVKPDVTRKCAMHVVCLENCDEFQEKYYTWSVSNPAIKVTSENNNVLILKENSMNTNMSNIIFTVSAKNGTAFSTYEMSVDEPFKSVGKCEITPSEGVSGITEFNFKCEGYAPSKKNIHLRYEFYQSQVYENATFDILLDYTTYSEVGHIVLAKGNEKKSSLYVKIIDPYGRFKIANISKLPNIKVMKVGDMFRLSFGTRDTLSLVNRANAGDTAGIVKLLSALVDAVVTSKENVTSRQNYKSQFVLSLIQAEVSGVSAARQISAILAKIGTLLPVPINSSVAERFLNIEYRVARQLRKIATDYSMQYKEVRDIYVDTLKMLAHVSHASRRTTEAVIEEESLSDVRYVIYEDLRSTDELIDLRETSQDIVKTMVEATEAIVNRIVETEEAIEDLSTAHAHILINRGIRLENKEIGDNKTGNVIRISPDLAEDIGTKLVAIKVVQLDSDIFWWRTYNLDMEIGSNSMYISVDERNTLVANEEDVFIPKEIDLNYPVEVFIKVRLPDMNEIQGVIDPFHSGAAFKDIVRVHRFYLRRGQRIQFEFTRLRAIKLKAVVVLDRLPVRSDFDDGFNIHSVIRDDNNTLLNTLRLSDDWSFRQSYRDDYVPTINEENRIIKYRDTPIVLHDYAHVYLGLIPRGNSLSRRRPYAFIPYVSSCQTWDDKKEAWDFETCVVHDNSTPNSLHCVCNHLSILSGSSFQAVSVPFDIRTEQLSEAIHGRWYPILILSLLMLVLIGVVIWASFEDKKDINKRKIIILADNSPSDRYAYLVTVYTGIHKDSGTSSSIGIKMKGEKGESEPHILGSKTSKILQSGAIDWFVIYTRRNLGELTELFLWNNLTGHYPAWFLSHVVVRDLQTKEGWVFIHNMWLSLAKGDGLHKCRLRPSSQKQIKSLRRRFLPNVQLFFREDHMWFSIFTTHPRSFYTRVERVGVLAFAATFCVLFCILVYDKIAEFNEKDYEDISNRFSWNNLLVAILGAHVCLPLSWGLSSLLRKSEPFSLRVIRDESIHDIYHEEYFVDIEMRDEMNFFQSFFFFFLPLVPICISNEPLPDGARNCSCKVLDKARKRKETCTRHRKEGLPFVHYHTFGCILPKRSRIVMWVLCIAGIIVFVSVSIYLSFYDEGLHTLEWLSTIFFMMAYSIFIVEPLKTVLWAVIATFIIKVESMDFDMDRGFPMTIIKDQLHIDKNLKMIRYLQEYEPIHSLKLRAIRYKEQARLRYKKLCTNMTIFVIYFLMSLLVIYTTESENKFWHTQHIKDMVLNGSYYGRGVSIIKDRTTVITYLKETLVPTLYRSNLRNGTLVIAPGYTADLYNQIVGSPRIRQLRVKQDVHCQYTAARENLACIPDYSKDTYDKENYYMSWERDEGDSKFFTRRASREYWSFKHNSVTGGAAIIGEIASYTGGGYTANLGRNRENGFLVVSFLDDYGWLDQLTRFVAIEIVLFNGNTGFLTAVDIVVEFTTTGYSKVTDHICTLPLGESSAGLMVLEIFFFLALGLLVFQRIQSVQMFTLKKQLRNIWNIIDIFLILITFLCVATYFFRDWELAMLDHKIENLLPSGYLDLHVACRAHMMWTNLKGVWVFFATVRVVRLLMLFTVLRKMSGVFILGAKYLLILVLLLFVLLMIFSMFANLSLSNYFYEFRAPMSGFPILTAHMFGRNKNADPLFHFQPVWGRVFYIVLGVMSTIVVVNLFRVALIEAYAERTDELAQRGQETYTLYDYLKEEYRYHCLRRKEYKKTSNDRLRGGGDSMMQNSTKEHEDALEDDTSNGRNDARSANDIHRSRLTPTNVAWSAAASTKFNMKRFQGALLLYFNARRVKFVKAKRGRRRRTTQLKEIVDCMIAAKPRRTSRLLGNEGFASKIRALNECLDELTNLVCFVSRTEEELSSVLISS